MHSCGSSRLSLVPLYLLSMEVRSFLNQHHPDHRVPCLKVLQSPTTTIFVQSVGWRPRRPQRCTTSAGNLTGGLSELRIIASLARLPLPGRYDEKSFHEVSTRPAEGKGRGLDILGSTVEEGFASTTTRLARWSSCLSLSKTSTGSLG